MLIITAVDEVSALSDACRAMVGSCKQEIDRLRQEIDRLRLLDDEMLSSLTVDKIRREIKDQLCNDPRLHRSAMFLGPSVTSDSYAARVIKRVAKRVVRDLLGVENKRGPIPARNLADAPMPDVPLAAYRNPVRDRIESQQGETRRRIVSRCPRCDKWITVNQDRREIDDNGTQLIVHAECVDASATLRAKQRY